MRRLSILVLSCVSSAGASGVSTVEGGIGIHALHQGTSSYPKSSIVEHQGSERVSLDWVCWYVELGEHKLLLDAGIGAPAVAERWGVEDWASCADRLRERSVDPAAITHVFITHGHFDHAGGLLDFPNATVVMNRSTPSMLAQTTGKGVSDGVGELEEEGRLVLTEGDQVVLPGVEVIHSGGHTRGHQAIRVSSSQGVHIFVGDACYTVDLCLAGSPLPTSVAVDTTKNRAFLEKLSAWLDEGATVRTMHDVRSGSR